MWPVLALIAALLALSIHLLWRRRFRSAILSREVEIRNAREIHREALGAAEIERRIFLDSLTEGLLLLDKEGRIRTMNRALEISFDVVGDPGGRSIMEVFRDHRLVDLADRLREEGEVRHFEVALPGIESRFLEINGATTFDAGNEPTGFVLVFHDVTRLRNLEKTRQEFVANVSHELRTPLSMIKGYVETLIDGAMDDPGVSGKFLRTIDKHADRLTFLINDLLALSKLESGELALNRERGKLRPLVEKVIQEFQSRASENKVRLEHGVPGEFEVFADFARLEQVLGNLVDNAVKYTPENGRVRISARVTASGLPEISVRDDGPGIPPEARERVFERFFRVEKSRSRDLGGTGLGLAIVKHVVHSHGGRVWVESEGGKGSTFRFTLDSGEK